MNYYNEFDPYAAQWLRILMLNGHIPFGFVDERSIVDVRAEDLEPYTQCHFFAGFGGWARALRLAGWPDDKPVWTGSPPCQPFSVAGKQLGNDDERHLAPTWLNLVSERKPPVIFGEQVEAAIRQNWLDDLQDHLEAENYACGSIVLPACGVGSPHIRQRLWFVAERMGNPGGKRLSEQQRLDGNLRKTGSTDERETSERRSPPTGRMANTESVNSGSGLRDSESPNLRGDIPGDSSAVCGLADTNGAPRRKNTGSASRDENAHGGARRHEVKTNSHNRHTSDGEDRSSRPTNGFWRDADWLGCRDGKWRPVESSTFPLANGVPARVGRLRAYGNAIVPQVAAEVISAYMSYED